MGIKKSYDALYTEWARVSHEVSKSLKLLKIIIRNKQVKVMEAAATQYEALCLNRWSLGLEPLCPWATISALMKDYGSREAWMANKVKYAWHHGLATLLSNILLVCT